MTHPNKYHCYGEDDPNQRANRAVAVFQQHIVRTGSCGARTIVLTVYSCLVKRWEPLTEAGWPVGAAIARAGNSNNPTKGDLQDDPEHRYRKQSEQQLISPDRRDLNVFCIGFWRATVW